jgi:hypothetical protein
MSLEKISTELDERIASQLVGQPAALAALCRTSKYYRSMVEHLLYGTINIQNNIELGMKRLLMTLLESPHLAKHIKSFTIGRFVSRDTSNEKIIPEFEKYRPQVAQAIDKVGPQMHGAVPRWNEKVFAQCHDPKNKTPSSTIDAVLALILSMADNIEQVRLNTSSVYYMSNTRTMLAPQVLPGNRLQSCQQLKNLEIHAKHAQGDLGMFLQTRAHRLLVQGYEIRSIQKPPSALSPLRTLELRNIRVHPDVLHSMLSMSAFGNLRHLVLDRVDEKRLAWRSYNFCRLSALLENCLPNLESLSCINFHMNQPGNITGFQSLGGLCHLQTLQIDLGLVIDQVLQSKHHEYKALLPLNVKRFELTNIEGKELEVLFQGKDEQFVHGSDGEDYSEACKTVWGLITSPPSKPALESLTINVTTKFESSDKDDCYYQQLSKTTRSQLQAAVVSAAAQGLSFSVVERTGLLKEMRSERTDSQCSEERHECDSSFRLGWVLLD